MAIQITEFKLLVVEGKEEAFFFGSLIKYLGLQNIQVVPVGGKNSLRDGLKALVVSQGFSEVISLGVVRDADTDPSAAFQSVRDALRAVNLPAPEYPIVPIGDNPRVTIMILPEKGKPGMLEDLCLRAVVSDPAMFCVEQYLQCLQQQGLSVPHNTSKAKVQVFLASKPEAGKRLGEAAQAGYWPWNDNAFEQVRNFLQQIGS